MNLEGLTTEARNEATKKIDQVSTLEMVTLINQEDQKVAQAIEKVLPQIAAASQVHLPLPTLRQPSIRTAPD